MVRNGPTRVWVLQDKRTDEVNGVYVRKYELINSIGNNSLDTKFFRIIVFYPGVYNGIEHIYEEWTITDLERPLKIAKKI